MQTEKRRAQWLSEAVKLAGALDAIRDLTDETYRRSIGDDDDPKEKILGNVAESAKIRADLAKIETAADPRLGASALINADELSPVIHHALTLMILGCVTSRFTGRRHDVVDLAELAVRNDLTEALELRRTFRNDTGILRPLVSLDASHDSAPLGARWIELKENAFNLAMGLPEDTEFERIELQSLSNHGDAEARRRE